MTGLTKIEEFNEFFIKEYKYLLGFAKSINNKNDYESLLHNCYIKCHQRIKLNGYSGSTYMNFMRVTLMNTYKTNYRDTKYTVNLESNDYIDEVEDMLLIKEEYEEQMKNYNDDITFLNTCAFEYVNKYFNEKENMVFKTYYILKHKHLNYKQLALATNYSITSVSNIIKKIKKELRINLMCYINKGMSVMELKEQLTKVEILLQKPLNKNLGEYKSYYLLIFGKPFTSNCSCNINQLREALKQWYNKNK